MERPVPDKQAPVASAHHESRDEQKLISLSRSISKIDPDLFPEVIVVASAVNKHDKGNVAVHLASAIARMPGQSVFLIDADLASPSIHLRFDYHDLPGLSEYLEGECVLSSLILKPPVDRLQLLPAGHVKGSVSSLLSSEKMSRFIHELKTKCPGIVIIINTDLVKVSEEVPPFVKHADGVVLSIDESLLPRAMQNKPIVLPGKAKLLGSIRKHSLKQNEEISRVTASLKKIGKGNSQAISNPALAHDKKTSSTLITVSQPDSYEAEQFNKLTADMIKSDILTKHQVFMFTSPSSGEGKSYVSSNAAVSLARNTGKHVLIIDCDLRSPSIHTYFNLSNETGLSDFLAQDNVALADHIQATGIENLSILPAGPFKANALQLLSSDKMERLLAGLKKRFKDMIIILDAAPPSLMAEGCVVSKFADSIVLVASHKRTNVSDMKKLTQLLDQKKIYGVIYNNYSGSRTTYNIYKKYNSYKKAA